MLMDRATMLDSRQYPQWCAILNAAWTPGWRSAPGILDGLRQMWSQLQAGQNACAMASAWRGGAPGPDNSDVPGVMEHRFNCMRYRGHGFSTTQMGDAALAIAAQEASIIAARQWSSKIWFPMVKSGSGRIQIAWLMTKNDAMRLADSAMGIFAQGCNGARSVGNRMEQAYLGLAVQALGNAQDGLSREARRLLYMTSTVLLWIVVEEILAYPETALEDQIKKDGGVQRHLVAAG